MLRFMVAVMVTLVGASCTTPSSLTRDDAADAAVTLDVPSETAYQRLLDVSNGIEQISEWCGDQVDDGYEGSGVSVAPGPCSGGLEDAVEALHAGVVVV